MAEAPPAVVLHLSPEELRALRDRGAAFSILDVREPWELALCKFEGSLDIPLSELPERLDEMEREGDPLVVVCHHGARSLNATVWLRANGVKRAINLQGGIDAWAREIDPSLKLY